MPWSVDVADGSFQKLRTLDAHQLPVAEAEGLLFVESTTALAESAALRTD